MITCILESGKRVKFRHVAVSVLLVKRDRVLLVKRLDSYTEGGKWDLPGGFLDRGETVAQGALRELLEETGWQGKSPVLFRINSNPKRPGEDWQNVSFVYLVEPEKKIQGTDGESSQIRWFPLGNVPSDRDMAFDHAEDLRLYMQYRLKSFSLPRVA